MGVDYGKDFFLEVGTRIIGLEQSLNCVYIAIIFIGC